MYYWYYLVLLFKLVSTASFSKEQLSNNFLDIKFTYIVDFCYDYVYIGTKLCCYWWYLHAIASNRHCFLLQLLSPHKCTMTRRRAVSRCRPLGRPHWAPQPWAPPTITSTTTTILTTITTMATPTPTATANSRLRRSGRLAGRASLLQSAHLAPCCSSTSRTQCGKCA